MRLASLSIVVFAIGCGGEAPAPKSLTTVRVKTVARANAHSGTRYSANIEPASRVDLAFKVGGYVQRVAQVKGPDGKKRILQEGDSVNAGMELAAVRVADYEQKQSEARASMSEAEAAHDKAQLDYDRAQKLVGQAAMARSELDSARTKLDSTAAQVEGARVRASEATTALSDSHLRAPMNGVIAKRNIEVGTLAQPGTVAFSIVDTSSVKVVFGVPDTELEALRLGTLQTVRTEAFHDRVFEGHITRIAPVADPKSRVFEVEVSIPNPEGSLRPGMVGALDLDRGSLATPLALVPLSAIVRAPAHPGHFALFVLNGKDTPPTVSLREVELGEFLGNQIPIRSGINDGDLVVVQGATLVSDGEKVQVIP